jgi:hypothetical protein
MPHQPPLGVGQLIVYLGDVTRKVGMRQRASSNESSRVTVIWISSSS